MNINKKLIILILIAFSSYCFCSEEKKQLSEGTTPLMRAIENGDNQVIKDLMAKKNITDINTQNKNGDTALTLAIRNGYIDLVPLLLYKGANYDLQNNMGITPIMYAAQNGSLKTIEILLKYDADPNMQSKIGQTALMYAIENGHTDVVKLLLNNPKVDLSLVNNDGKTAFQIAQELGR